AKPEVLNDYSRLQTLAKERSGLEEVVSLFRQLREVEEQLEEAREIVDDGSDAELTRLAREEIEGLEPEHERLEQAMRLTLLPVDPRDDRNVIVEIRAGTGGEEASLFAGDLFRMYARYAEKKRWPIEIISSNGSEKGCFKEIVFEVDGRGA